MISVLVVDDQPLVRGGLAALIGTSSQLRVAGEAANGDEAVAMTAAHRPDVVLMDIRMPGMDGLTATERILADPAPPRVLILTTHDLDEYVYTALRIGASGFLLKDASPEQVLAAIHAVATGDVLIAPAVTRRLIEQFAERTRLRDDAHPDLRLLTAREIEVLRLVGTGISNAEIADRLSVSDGTVKTHLHRAMHKLGLCSRAQAVVVAYETGLVTPGHR
ncbi:response regulator transcription factor [Nocardia sp. CDC159]|uniref:Response regulator transcription factor n=1 Tax=Nocardia pulmonis TaxID=2951408 RepID=A0A9X2E6Z9_9NOCA|nr:MULTISPECIES: response regulator transcription factor [Nocardia]MCM6775394.1 response regulator transcription factor [Nocardia pulmonis]MCM6787872.1 response regulator transcription factor [Nocardia sp. CDC159]